MTLVNISIRIVYSAVAILSSIVKISKIICTIRKYQSSFTIKLQLFIISINLSFICTTRIIIYCRIFTQSIIKPLSRYLIPIRFISNPNSIFYSFCKVTLISISFLPFINAFAFLNSIMPSTLIKLGFICRVVHCPISIFLIILPLTFIKIPLTVNVLPIAIFQPQ